MNEVHYANLTRGLLCPFTATRFCRIQSTHCEQKQWGRVLHGAGPDLLMHLALGIEVVVHDRSERDRPTRAQWQGLEWLRIACSLAWGSSHSPVRGRGGVAMTCYLEQMWRDLPRPDQRYVTYYGRYSRGRPVQVRGCDCRDAG